MTRVVHPIEQESYRILRSRVDLTHLPPLTRAVTERVVHASADLDYVTGLVCDESWLISLQRACSVHPGARAPSPVSSDGGRRRLSL
ncbi:precorrin-8X methylmutase, partial [Micromonospora sp. ATA51]|uniref:precorrin-8X methylmutase n=1 Tax=Micromonospora sp. ATA51 TaxID=2806098 RepID=UPI001A5C8FEF